MESTLMSLKILLPNKVFADLKNVKRIVAETSLGSFGFWPKRLDCTAILVPGILVYETGDDGVNYVAVDGGVLVKTGSQVYISVRNAIGNVPLGKLKELVDTQMKQVDEKTINIRSAMAKLESSFIRSVQQLKKE
jgi:F-type H+-transporting ATPase subunit epsilon